ncbi:MAG TPA: flagellar hook-associated protein FlgK [Steroidobacteraceae bacterium]|jgi:flagellar hook-associated protein 1 FlgK
MSDLLSNGVSALQAFQRSLDVISNNISNVATPGYSRQTASLVTNPAQQYGNGFVGSGVSVNTITRTYNEYLAGQVRTSNTSYQRSNEFATDAAQVDNMFADPTTGLSAGLQKFASAVQDMANSPSTSAPRQVVLSQAQALAQQLQGYTSQLQTYSDQVDQRIQSTANDISGIAKSIAQLNSQIALAAGSGQPPNDLLDQRDQLLNQLSQDVNVSTSTQDNQVNVYIGNGQPLVIGATASTVGTVPNAYDPTRSDIVIKTNGANINVTSDMTGGTLGGMLDFRNQVLDPAQSQLGLISVGLASAVNTQQAAGIDLNGNAGAPMFSVGGVQVQTSSQNGGNASLAVTRSNVAGLTGSDYILADTAGGWQLTNKSTGAVVTMTGAGTSASPFVADGMSIVVSGTASVSDKFLIRPTAAASAGLAVTLTDPSQIAAASPIKTAAATTNTGTGTISAPTVNNPANPLLRNAATITFPTATTYSVNGGPSLAYNPGTQISANGWTVTISGSPAAGDSFTVKDNAGATGDNTNALALAGVFDQKGLNSGADSINSYLGRFVGNLGTVTQQAQNDASAQKSVNTSDSQALSNASGVSLDEEAANLIKFQQAYQAAAQMISVASTLFESVLQAARGQ